MVLALDFRQTMRAFCALLTVCLLIPLAIANDDPDAASVEYLTSISNTKYHLHKSESLSHDYHVYVLAPEESESQDKYATVYLLDGGITFPLLAAYSRYLSLANEIPPLILVGISYGTDDFRLGNRRSTDFTAPAENRDHYGGAAAFQSMLFTELFPLIEQNYPSDPSQRILFGQSIGGQFSIYNAMTKPDKFLGMIASNPALHRNLDFFLAPKVDERKVKRKSRLFVSTAAYDDDRFKVPANKWLDHWQAIEGKPFILETHQLENENHFSAAPTAFKNGLKWIFADQPE